MRITIIYDNEVKSGLLKAGWGFSCLVETPEMPRILFDTGADGPTLLSNMAQMGIDPESIGIIFISHAHGDHTGGLKSILATNKAAEIYVPASFPLTIPGRKVIHVTQPLQIYDAISSTGELKGIEQSLIIKTGKGIILVVGCSHPGVSEILDVASRFGEVYGIVGGLHGFHDFQRLHALSLIGPCHCTQYKKEILGLFPKQCVKCGAGLVIEE